MDVSSTSSAVLTVLVFSTTITLFFTKPTTSSLFSANLAKFNCDNLVSSIFGVGAVATAVSAINDAVNHLNTIVPNGATYFMTGNAYDWRELRS
jgi:hypothetical protein